MRLCEILAHAGTENLGKIMCKRGLAIATKNLVEIKANITLKRIIEIHNLLQQIIAIILY